MAKVPTTDPTSPPAARRRRSRYISTLLLGAAALSLSGCGEEAVETEARVFPTVEACRAEFPAEECDKAFEASRDIHLQTAPRYASAAECEAENGPEACQQTVMANPNGGVSSVFVPALMGFMLGRALDGGRYPYGFGYGGRNYYPRPVYVDRDGFLRSGSRTIGQVPGGRDSFLSSRSASTVTTTTTRSGEVGRPTRTSRGGFGRSSARFGGGG